MPRTNQELEAHSFRGGRFTVKRGILLLFLLMMFVNISMATEYNFSVTATITQASTGSNSGTKDNYICGDGVCEGDENSDNCPEDCVLEVTYEETEGIFQAIQSWLNRQYTTIPKNQQPIYNYQIIMLTSLAVMVILIIFYRVQVFRGLNKYIKYYKS